MGEAARTLVTVAEFFAREGEPGRLDELHDGLLPEAEAEPGRVP